MPDPAPAPARRPAGGWGRYLAEYHDANPGITEDVLGDARDHVGRTPYGWLVEAIPRGPSTVVDLGCGSGPVCRILSCRPRGMGETEMRRVVGVDQSAGELARARSAPPSGLLVQARACALPIADSTADVVVSSMALMLVPLAAVLAEVGRVLHAGGTFVATVPMRSTGVGGGRRSAFGEILGALGQAGTDYPEPLDGGLLVDRFSASGLTLLHDDTGLFTRTIDDPEDAGLVVRSFYAPGVDDARVDGAVARFQRRVRSAPVPVGYRIRRLVAVR